MVMVKNPDPALHGAARPANAGVTVTASSDPHGEVVAGIRERLKITSDMDYRRWPTIERAIRDALAT